MNSTRHVDGDDLALFAMQFLSDSEAEPIKLHLDHCNQCLRELGEVQGDLAIYASTVELHSPPAQARDRLLKQVGREKRESKVRSIDRATEAPASETAVPSVPAGRTPLAASAVPAREGLASATHPAQQQIPVQAIAAKFIPWLGWAVAAGLAITAGELYHERSELQSTLSTEHAQMGRLTADAEAAHRLMDTMTDPSAMRVTLTRSRQAPAPQGKATYVPEKGTLVFIASNMAPLQPYKVYELWIIPVDGRDPIPAGTFHPDERGNATVIMPELPKGVPAKAFGITIEDQGGSRTPTMPIIMAGT